MLKFEVKPTDVINPLPVGNYFAKRMNEGTSYEEYHVSDSKGVKWGRWDVNYLDSKFTMKPVITVFKSIQKLFKYGSFNEEEIYTFITEKELEDHLKAVRATEAEDANDPDFYNKWTLEVSASNGEMFTIKLDL